MRNRNKAPQGRTQNGFAIMALCLAMIFVLGAHSLGSVIAPGNPSTDSGSSGSSGSCGSDVPGASAPDIVNCDTRNDRIVDHVDLNDDGIADIRIYKYLRGDTLISSVTHDCVIDKMIYDYYYGGDLRVREEDIDNDGDYDRLFVIDDNNVHELFIVDSEKRVNLASDDIVGLYRDMDNMDNQSSDRSRSLRSKRDIDGDGLYDMEYVQLKRVSISDNAVYHKYMTNNTTMEIFHCDGNRQFGMLTCNNNGKCVYLMIFDNI